MTTYTPGADRARQAPYMKPTQSIPDQIVVTRWNSSFLAMTETCAAHDSQAPSEFTSNRRNTL